MSHENSKKLPRAIMSHRLLPSLMVVLLTALFIIQAPAYAQADSHEVEVSLEADLNRYRIEVANVVPPGPTTFMITNNTEVVQGFTLIGQDIEPVFIEAIEPRETVNVDVDLAEGVYFALSSTLSYTALGMELLFSQPMNALTPPQGMNPQQATPRPTP